MIPGRGSGRKRWKIRNLVEKQQCVGEERTRGKQLCINRRALRTEKEGRETAPMAYLLRLEMDKLRDSTGEQSKKGF